MKIFVEARIQQDKKMQLPWFDLTEVNSFANRLVQDLHRVSTGGKNRGEKMSQTMKRVEKLLEQASVFEKTHGLNVYKKASLLTMVRLGLKEKGWASADTEAIINQLLTNRLR